MRSLSPRVAKFSGRHFCQLFCPAELFHFRKVHFYQVRDFGIGINRQCPVQIGPRQLRRIRARVFSATSGMTTPGEQVLGCLCQHAWVVRLGQPRADGLRVRALRLLRARHPKHVELSQRFARTKQRLRVVSAECRGPTAVVWICFLAVLQDRLGQRPVCPFQEIGRPLVSCGGCAGAFQMGEPERLAALITGAVVLRVDAAGPDFAVRLVLDEP